MSDWDDYIGVLSFEGGERQHRDRLCSLDEWNGAWLMRMWRASANDFCIDDEPPAVTYRLRSDELIQVLNADHAEWAKGIVVATLRSLSDLQMGSLSHSADEDMARLAACAERNLRKESGRAWPELAANMQEFEPPLLPDDFETFAAWVPALPARSLIRSEAETSADPPTRADQRLEIGRLFERSLVIRGRSSVVLRVALAVTTILATVQFASASAPLVGVVVRPSVAPQEASAKKSNARETYPVNPALAVRRMAQDTTSAQGAASGRVEAVWVPSSRSKPSVSDQVESNPRHKARSRRNDSHVGGHPHDTITPDPAASPTQKDAAAVGGVASEARDGEEPEQAAVAGASETASSDTSATSVSSTSIESEAGGAESP